MNDHRQSPDCPRTASVPLAVQVMEHPFLKEMKPEHLERLISCAMESHFDKGEVIFREGDPANRFYLIQRGKIALESNSRNRTPNQVGTLEAGDVLGWSWLFPPYIWHFNARAIEPTDAIFFYGTRLREECDEDHDFGYEMMRRVAAVVIDRLQVTRRRLVAPRPDGSTP